MTERAAAGERQRPRVRGTIALRHRLVVREGHAAPVVMVGVGAVMAVLVVFARRHDGSLASDPVGSFNDVLVGVLLIAAGIVGWWRLPGDPTGILLVATGFAWWLVDVSRVGGGAAWTTGHVLMGVYLAIGVQALVGFPGGGAVGRLALVTVVAAYVVKVLLQPMLLLFRDPQLHGCPGCGPNLVLIRDDPGVHQVIDVGTNVAQIAIAGALAWLLVTRFKGASLATRRALGPVLLAGGVVAVVGLVDSLVWLAEPNGGEVPSSTSRGFALCLGLIPAALLVGLLRARLARGAVAPLMVELGSDPAPDRLEAAIGRALGDPTCRIAFYLPDVDGYADASGTPVTLPDSDPGRVVTELHRDGEPIAALVCDRGLELNPTLLEGVASAARMSIENTRLQAELRAQLTKVRESRVRIVEASDDARRRFEQDLHDGTQQYVLKAMMDLDTAGLRIDGDPAALEAGLQAVRVDLDELLEALRTVARGLLPAILANQGLAGALDSIVGRAKIPAMVTRLPHHRLPTNVERAAYFVCVEALTNAQKHAHAAAVTIDVTIVDGVLHAVVQDDGRGGAAVTPDGGLERLRDRVEALDGSLAVTSTDTGTRVEALIPCE